MPHHPLNPMSSKLNPTLNPQTRILVVDDTEEMRSLFSEICKSMGFTDVSESKNGVEAWQIIKNAHPHFELVISDFSMPHNTGLELLHKVRADHQLHNTAFIMVSAQEQKHIAQEIVNSGANYYLVKPFTVEQFENAIHIALTRRHQFQWE